MTSRTRNVALGIGGGLAILLIAGRLALPDMVKYYVNRSLNANTSYSGHVDDVDIALIRGAYVIQGITIDKRGGTAPVPFMVIDTMDLSVQWKALIQGSLVAEVELLRPRVNFVSGPTEADKQAGSDVDWRQQVKELAPLRINRFAVKDGEVHYSDFSTQPKVDVRMTNLDLEAYNLTNSESLSGTLVATVDATGRVQDYGDFTVHSTLDPYADAATFDLAASMTGVKLTSMNDLLQAYGKLDVKSGSMDVYSEVTAKQGNFTGYVKPMFTDLQVFSIQQDIGQNGDGPLRVAWESVVGAGAKVLKNNPTDRVAAKIPIKGTVTAPAVDAWSAALSTVSNAYVEALRRGLESHANPQDNANDSVAGEPERRGLFNRQAKGPNAP